MHACSAAVLNERLCKLQSEAGLGFIRLFSGRGGERGENSALRFTDMETATVAYILHGPLSQGHGDKRRLKISWVFPVRLSLYHQDRVVV